MKAFMMSAVLLAVFTIPAWACGTSGASVCGTESFTPGTRYMSQAGYLRWQEYQAHGTWLTQQEAVKMTKEQLKFCPVVIDENPQA